MNEQVLLVSVEEGIAKTTFNRPEARNALSEPLKQALIDTLLKLDADDNVKVLVLTGAGKAFCAGGDLQNFKQKYEDFSARGGGKEYGSSLPAETMLKFSKPMIAAINGPAIGGGLTLSLACDIRLASDQAKFGATFVRVGLTPEYGSSFLLSRIVGIGNASELVLTGRIIDAAQAERIGLVNRVISHDRLLEEAFKVAKEIASHPPVAVQMGKRVLRHGMESTLPQAIDYESHLLTYCYTTLDHHEALTALLENRKPTFKGR